MPIKTICFTIVILVAASALNISAAPVETIGLIPQKGTHRFPFFDHPTPVWNYNNQIPGHTIRAKAGSTVIIEVLNRLEEPTSVHWHGLRIDNAMDGVPGVTQDPIAPQGRFTLISNVRRIFFLKTKGGGAVTLKDIMSRSRPRPG